MGEQYQLFFVQRFKGKVLFNVPMSRYTSIRVGGPADVMAFPRDEADLRDIMVFATTKNFPLFVLGGGTNLVVRDGGIRGIVVNMTEGFEDITWSDETTVVVESGVGLAALVNRLKERSLGGLEFAAGIPGTVGGAVAMNAGAYGRDMSGVVEGVEVIDRKGKKGFIPAAELSFSYRKTSLPKDSIIVRVHMRFEKKDRSEIEEEIDRLRKRREDTGSVGYPSAGSIFRNPEGGYAGRLIEEAGLKGYRIGDAQISDVHANYIINRGEAKARDVLALMALARDRVFGLKGIVLEPEVRVVGED